MAARDPQARSRSASIAANTRWAREPNRAEALAPARRNNPSTLDYWRAWAKQQHPDATPAAQLKTAKNAHRAHMQQLAAKSAKARAKRAGRDEAEQAS